ncbi:MAG: carboxypeptidase-like regulatory domain-containing protein, partial [Chitinophagaceae bacterium]|nr:carboxypeptidase-like regulatory domain-containing protein [Chitinophagaceae bacterium]
MSTGRVCLLLFIALLPLQVFAQVGDSTRNKESLSVKPKVIPNYTGFQMLGTVTDAEDGEPVPFTTVFISGSTVGTNTDADGRFIIQIRTLPGDSIKVQQMGYVTYAAKIDRSKKINEYDIKLERSASYLSEVVIKPGEDPAITLMRQVIKSKPRNNPDKLNNYKYESYNKIEIDLLNFKKKTFDKLPVPYLKRLGFIFDNMDTSSYDKPFLPAYLTEALSDYYYQKSPKKSKEYVKASQMKAIKNQNMTRSISQYLGKIYLAMNPYDNFVPFFDKEFVSPLGNSALSFYKYKILDTQNIDGYKVISLSFKPQRKGEQCFEGTLRIVDSIYALQYITAGLPEKTDINWVKKSDFYKEYSPLGDSLWFCTKENITAELELSDEVMKTLGFVVRKTTSYNDILVNDKSIAQKLNSKELKADVVVADSATQKGEEFWKNARHDTLSTNESGIYAMYDSLENNRNYNRLKTLIKIVGTGGYKFGPIELGPYWNAYSYNQIEGNR